MKRRPRFGVVEIEADDALQCVQPGVQRGARHVHGAGQFGLVAAGLQKAAQQLESVVAVDRTVRQQAGQLGLGKACTRGSDRISEIRPRSRTSADR